MTAIDPDGAWANRYSRQILLKEIGGEGQKRLNNASLGLVGAGTVGMTALLYLGAAGIGRLCIADDAQITTQGIYPHLTTGTAKVFAAATALQALNPTIQIEPLDTHLTPATLPAWMANLDLILDCALAGDWLNSACCQFHKPLLSTWFTPDGFSWLAGSKAGLDPQFPCLACNRPTVLPVTPKSTKNRLQQGLVGTLLATEAIKTVLNLDNKESWTTLLGHDPDTGAYHRLPNPKNHNCPVCSNQPSPIPKHLDPLEPMDPIQADATIDITQESCPMTFVRVKLKLETMAPGQKLYVRLKGEEPLINLPRTLADEGCTVSLPWQQEDAFGLLVTKPDIH